MLDVSNATVNFKTYRGLSCKKLGLTIDGIDYILKFPANLKSKNMKNTTLSYSNSSVSEFLGSKIYEKFNIPVHDVQLVMYKGKLCALCKDFSYKGTLQEFQELKTTIYDDDTVEKQSDGTDTDLEDVLYIIRNQHILKQLPEYETFFWKMFVIDALIGNHDRNNGNHGVLRSNSISIAPVYDNGGCLSPTWDENKMKHWLQDDSKMTDLAYRVNTCCFKKNDKVINPFQLIESKYYPGLNNALCEVMLTPFTEIESVINSCEILTNTQKEFYVKLLKLRYDKLTVLSNSCHALTIMRYAETYGIPKSDIQSEIRRLMSVTGSKSVIELSGYIQDNFL